METTKELPGKNNAEYKLLAKGLEFCPKPKQNNNVHPKQDVFEFTRKLREKELFDSRNEDSDTEQDNEDLKIILSFLRRVKVIEKQ